MTGKHQKAIVAYVQHYPGCTLSELMTTTPSLCSNRMSIGGGWYRPWSVQQKRIEALVRAGRLRNVGGRFFLSEPSK